MTSARYDTTCPIQNEISLIFVALEDMLIFSGLATGRTNIYVSGVQCSEYDARPNQVLV